MSIGGYLASTRNLIAGNFLQAAINLNSVTGTTIAGNLIGTTYTGQLSAVPAGLDPVAGIYVSGTNISIDANVIAGLAGPGIRIEGASGLSILRNAIGIGVAGVVLHSGMAGQTDFMDGITVLNGPNGTPSTQTHIYSNGIMHNLGVGVRVGQWSGELTPGPQGVRIDGNAIWSNGAQGIDLARSGDDLGTVTPNDAPGALDADTGPNGLQNFPVITSATQDAAGISHVAFTLDSAANRSYAITGYSSTTCDPSGHGPGQYPGNVTVVVTTDAAGHASGLLTVPLLGGWTPGRVATLLATDQTSNNTSEFSACKLITPGAVKALDIDGNGSYDALTDGVLLVRYLFGLRGAPMIAGAVGAGATRTTAADIETYLAGQAGTLDIDGNGQVDALTDGLLAIRYLFGLRGANLTAGAVGTGAVRATAAAIEAYLATITPP